MSPSRIFLAALLFSAAPLPAGAAPPTSEAPAGGDEAAEAKVHELHIPGYDGDSSGSWLEIEIAPEIVSHNPLGSESRTSDVTNVSVTFVTTQPLSDSLEIEFDAGPSVAIDTDNDASSESALAASLELRTRQNGSGFASFLSYGIARDYTDFFDAGLDTSHAVTTGLRYGSSIGPAEVGFELAPRWVDSSHDVDDYLAVELWMEGVFPVISDGISLTIDMAVDRRWYQNVDPAILAKRRDWRFEAFVGLDFADALAPWPGNTRLIRSLEIGGRWVEVNSNLDDADRSSLKLLPAIMIGFSF